MAENDPDIERLERVRQAKRRDEPDLSLSSLGEQFEREVAKPFRQLGPLGELWRELLPAELVEHTKLQGVSRGELRVAVDSASYRYELDRLLRQGVEQELISRHSGAISRVRVRIARIE